MTAERHFDEKLKRVEQALLGLAEAAEVSIDMAVRSLLNRDPSLARWVIAEGKRVDGMEVEVEEACLALFALQAPVAVDMRHVASMLKANTDLERIDDQAVNIAEAALVLAELPPVKPLVDIPRMAEIAGSMAHQAVRAFATRDVALADAVRRQDDELDQLCDQVFRELLTYMMADPATVDRAIRLILVSRHLERIGDHAANIAEDVVYLVRGRIVRHQQERLRSRPGGDRETDLPA